MVIKKHYVNVIILNISYKRIKYQHAFISYKSKIPTRKPNTVPNTVSNIPMDL